MPTTSTGSPHAEVRQEATVAARAVEVWNVFLADGQVRAELYAPTADTVLDTMRRLDSDQVGTSRTVGA